MSVRSRRGHGREAGGRIGRGVGRVGVLLLLGGCVTPTVRYKDEGKAVASDPYIFTITFQNGCPVKATVDFQNCSPQQEDCVHVAGGPSVKVVSSPAGNDFVLQFDQFGKTAIPSSGGVLEATTETHPKKGKSHTFLVRGRDCPTPLDPQII